MGIKVGHARSLRHRGSALFGVLSLLAASFLSSVAAAAPANAASPSCIISWSAAANGNWNTAANWTDTSRANRVPTSADDVCISLPGNYTVTQDVNVSVNSITVGGGQGLQTLQVPSGTSLSLAANSSVAATGVMTLGDGGNGNIYLRSSGVLTNAGTLNVVAGGGGARYLQTSIVNSGTVDVASANAISDTYVSVPTLTNTGTFKVEPGGGYTLSSGAGITNTAGTISNAGSVSMVQSPFIQRGGSTTGNPILLTSGTLDDDTTAGPGLFLVHGGTLTGTGTSPGIAAEQTVTLDSGGIVSMTGNLTNAGTLNVGSSNPGTADFRGGLLTNTGTFNVVAGGGEARYVRVSIANSGTMDIASPNTISDSYINNVTTLTNSGTFTVHVGANYSFYNGSAFTQAAAGSFATFVNAANGAIGSIGGGPVHVDGTLQVATTGTPAIGTTYQVVTGAVRTGTFATSQFTGGFYDVTYPNTGVTLTAKAAPLAAPVFTADSPPATGRSERLTATSSWRRATRHRSMPCKPVRCRLV